MAEEFFGIGHSRQLKALQVAELASNRAFHILEKDCWVVWALRELFTTSLGEHLVFKGGTSLSKGYRVIDRFSEDIDLTYNIKKLIPDLVGNNVDAIPTSRSQKDKWVRQIKIRLQEWITDCVVPVFEDAIQRNSLSAKLRVDDSSFDRVFIDYEPLKPLPDSSSYVSPPVILEFGATSTGKPCGQRNIVCYAAGHQGPEPLDYPEVEVKVLKAERTVWEKATAAHVYCLRERARGQRFFRHWYDLVHLEESGHVEEALLDRALAMSVARQKKQGIIRYSSKTTFGNQRPAFPVPIVPV